MTKFQLPKNRHDLKFMRMALKLAGARRGLTNPNPTVGAVVVKRGKIVGSGFHKKCGLPHAEVNALVSAGDKAKGADLYVTLEPCCHFGRTPPCTDAIIRAGIKRVVIAKKDPNPINNGKGSAKLRRAGIKTIVGILAQEAAALNRPYAKFIRKKIPYVTLKMAQSLDGKIATRTGDSKWVTSESSRRYVDALRGRVDAVMVGAKTVLKDDPSLTCKIPGAKQPLRIVAGGRSRIPRSAKILYDNGSSEVLIVRGPGGRVDLQKLLEKLGDSGVAHILVEGGGELAASFIKERLVDQYLFFIAPKIIGGRDAVTSVEGDGIKDLGRAVGLKNVSVHKIGEDLLIEAYAT